MEQYEFLSDISKYLISHSKLIKNVRDHLPMAVYKVCVFKNTFDESKFSNNYYSFIDYIVDNFPANVEISFDNGDIVSYDYDAKLWVTKNKIRKNLVNALNELESNVLHLRMFKKYLTYKK